MQQRRKLNKELLEEFNDFIEFLRGDFTIIYDRKKFAKLNELFSYIKFKLARVEFWRTLFIKLIWSYLFCC